MKRGKRPSMTRLKLTTADIATLYGVTEHTVRTWISKGKLTFTGNAIEDFIALSRHWSERSEATKNTELPKGLKVLPESP